MFFFPLAIAVLMAAFGISALRLNRHRPTNQVLAAVCFISSAIFTFQLIARYQGWRYGFDHVSNPMPWVRLRFACIGLLCPLMVWMSYYVVSGRYTSRVNLALKLAPWALISAALVGITFTEAFKDSASRPGLNLDGPLYAVFFAVMLGCQLAACIASIVVGRRLRGIRHLEFRFITIAFGYLSLVVVLTAFIQNFYRDVPWLLAVLRALALLVFPLFGLTAWSVTSRRIYHNTQILLPIVERLGIILIVALPVAFILRWLPASESGIGVRATIVGAACVVFLLLDQKLRGVLNLNSEQRINAVAGQLQRIANAEADPDRLIERCESVLRSLVGGSEVRVLKLDQDRYERGDLVFTAGELAETPLTAEGFASAPVLARLFRSGSGEALRRRLEKQRVNLLVAPRWSEHEPGLIIAFGERENGVPFTYPEIKILGALAEIVDRIYTRTRFALQARQSEQLATIGLIGAGLAHELRNPIVAIDTFAQLLPRRLHDTEFLRDFAEVIPSEAKRIQALAEQLLDLARPRNYDFVPVDLHAVISETVFLLSPQANASRVELAANLAACKHTLIGDAHSLRQVLMNLIQNAVQSITRTGEAGRVMVRTADAGNDVIIEITDTGPGIPEKIRSRLFQPFATAEKKAGLGLGLAICAEIATVHRGVIAADNAPTGGAIFRVTLPTSDHANATADETDIESHSSAVGPADSEFRTGRSHSTAA